MVEPVKLPRSYSSNYRFHPIKLQMKLSRDFVSTARMVLQDDATTLLSGGYSFIHSYIELYNAFGSAGVFRVTSVTKTYGNTVTFELAHAVDSFSDSIVAVADRQFSGTVQELIELVLRAQKNRTNPGYWQLGTCTCTSTIEKDVSWMNCLDILEEIADAEPDYYFTYDFTTDPWTINFVERPNVNPCEFRLGRNVITLNVTRDDSELCNQVVVEETLRGSDTVTKYTYDNLESQQYYGIVQRHESITADTHSWTTSWANAYLEERKKPLYNISIDGYNLLKLTNLAKDAIVPGRYCRVALPEYGETIFETVASVEYPDALTDPYRCKVVLAKTIHTGTEQFKKVQKQLVISYR